MALAVGLAAVSWGQQGLAATFIIADVELYPGDNTGQLPGDKVGELEDEHFINTARDPGTLASASLSRTGRDPNTSLPSWIASGEARVEPGRLRTRAFWDAGRPGGGFQNGRVISTARVEDELHIAGDGRIAFTYTLSGRVEGRIEPAITPDSDFSVDELLDLSADFYVLLRRGFGDASSDRYESEPPRNLDRTTYLDVFDGLALKVEMEVSDGDEIDFLARATSRAGRDGRDDRLTGSRALSDFFSTATLTDVFVSDGVVMTAESGFDYVAIAAANAETDPELDPLPPVPVPAAAWLLLGGIGLLAELRRRQVR